MPNGFEALGGALRQAGGDIGAFGERQRQYQDMVQRRVVAMQEAARQEAEEKRRADKFKEDQEKSKVEQQEKDRIANTWKEINAGKTVPGMPPIQDDVVPYGREEIAGMLARSGGIKGSEYLDATKPAAASTNPIFKEGKDGFYHQYGPNGFEKTNLESPPPAAASQPRYVINEIGGRKVRVNLDTGEQMDLGPVTQKTNAKTEAQLRYDELPPEKQKQIDLLGTALGKRQNTINELESALAEFKAAKTDIDRERIGGGMLKTLNSPENPDAIGAEEEARIGNALKFQKMNILGQGQVFGRDFPGFETQVNAKIASMRSSREKNQANIDSLYGPKPATTQEAPADPRATKRAMWESKNTPKEGQTKVNSNGRKVVYRGGRWVAA
jgi:hypothetical protein